MNRRNQMDPDFVVVKCGWFTASNFSRGEEYNTIQRIFFGNIVHFLQGKGMLTREVLAPGELANDDTELLWGDFTPEGIEFYAYGITRWRAKYDRAKDSYKAINDFRFIEKKLVEFRAKREP